MISSPNSAAGSAEIFTGQICEGPVSTDSYLLVSCTVAVEYYPSVFEDEVEPGYRFLVFLIGVFPGLPRFYDPYTTGRIPPRTQPQGVTPGNATCREGLSLSPSPSVVYKKIPNKYVLGSCTDPQNHPSRLGMID